MSDKPKRRRTDRETTVFVPTILHGETCQGCQHPVRTRNKIAGLDALKDHMNRVHPIVPLPTGMPDEPLDPRD